MYYYKKNQFEKDIHKFNTKGSSNLFSNKNLERTFSLWAELLTTSNDVLIFEKDFSDVFFSDYRLISILKDYMNNPHNKLDIIIYRFYKQNDVIELFREYSLLYPKRIGLKIVNDEEKNKQYFEKTDNKEFNFITGDDFRFVYGLDFYNDYKSISSFNRCDLCEIFKGIFKKYLNL